MKKIFVASIILLMAFFTLRSDFSLINRKHSGSDASGGSSDMSQPQQNSSVKYREIAGNIRSGESLFDIFKRYKLDMKELFQLREASADVHKLRDLSPNRPYKIILDNQDQIDSFTYWIDDDTILRIKNTDSGFCAEKICVAYEKRVVYLRGTIKDNLVSSMENGPGGLLLALQLSDIFAWDIDFTTDLRNNDTYKIAVEGLYIDGTFRKYGDILAAEFMNNGETYHAYRYEANGKTDYYNEEGKSLRKAFLKAPLNFRRISSFFSKGRMHPILKINRPHHGLDYAAPAGTPVSVAGDGMVVFAGNRGQYGKVVIVRHMNGYHTYYGHLSRIARGMKRGKHALQGQVIGYVGSTGLATGPHLHYEMRIHDKPVNPLSIKIPRGSALPATLMAGFRQFKDSMNTRFASDSFRGITVADNKTDSKSR
jgi:murein DD-endopeptidase MepM/ murein hydrolase activator NlpD